MLSLLSYLELLSLAKSLLILFFGRKLFPQTKIQLVRRKAIRTAQDEGRNNLGTDDSGIRQQHPRAKVLQKDYGEERALSV